MTASSADRRIAALEDLIERDADRALRELSTLGPWWQEVGRVEDGRRLTDRALDRAGTQPSVHRAETLLVAAELAFRQGDQPAAVARAHEVIATARAIDQPVLAALAHVDLARVAYRDGDAAAIEAHSQTALALASNDSRARRGALHMLAWAAYTAGDRDLARRRFETSLAFRRESGDALSVAVELANIGDIAAEEGALRDGAVALHESLELMRDRDNRYFLVNTLPSVAALAGRAGLDEACALLVGAAQGLAAASGLVPDPGNGQGIVDEVAGRLGERFEALRSEGTLLDVPAAMTLAIESADRVAS